MTAMFFSDPKMGGRRPPLPVLAEPKPSRPIQGLVSLLRARVEGLPSDIRQSPLSSAPKQMFNLLSTTAEQTVSEVKKLRKASSQYLSNGSSPTFPERQGLRRARSQYLGGQSVVRRLFGRGENAIDSRHDDPIYTEHEMQTLGAVIPELCPGDSYEPHNSNYTFIKPAAFAYDDTSSGAATPFAFISGIPMKTTALGQLSRPIDLKDRVMAPNAVGELDPDRRVLLREISMIRTGAGMHNLRSNAELFRRAQNYADFLDSVRGADLGNATELRPNAVESGFTHTRLISGPGLTALSCAEIWRTAKDHRHALAVPANKVHAADCACREVVVFQALTDRTWEWIGLGRTLTGRWVVELAGTPAPEKKPSYGPEQRVKQDGTVMFPLRKSSLAQMLVGYGQLPKESQAEVRPGLKRGEGTDVTRLSFDYDVQKPDPLVVRKPVRRGSRKTFKTYQSSVYSREEFEDGDGEDREEKMPPLPSMQFTMERSRPSVRSKNGRPELATWDTYQPSYYSAEVYEGC